MTLAVYDRIQQTGTANTTVSFTLSATTTAYQSFAAVGNGNTTYYAATDGTNWEVGLGTYSTTGPTLTRTTILSSSNSNTAVTFSGTVTVWVDLPASKAVYQDASIGNDATINTIRIGLGGGSQANSTAFGFQALNATNTGQNTAIGYTAGKAITSGGNNVFVGQYSGSAVTTANYNTGVGHGALNASNADKNTALGFQALNATTSGQQNTAVGYGANQSNTIGQQNVVVGNNAMFAGVTGSNNVAVGNQAMQQSTGVNGMVAVGNGALISTTTTLNTGTTNVGTITPGSGYVAGTYTAVALSKIATGGGTSVINAGSYGTATVVVNADGTVHAGGVTIVNPGSGYVDTTTVLTVSNTLLGGSGSGFQFTLTGSLLSPSQNVGVGAQAISTNSTGSSITAVGYQAGNNATTGSNNVFVGTNAGYSSVASTTGSQLVYIGSGAHGSAATNQNEIVIGYNAVGLGSNTTTIGVSGTTALTQVYGTLNTSGYTFSTLPSTAATGKVTGARTFITDASTTSAAAFGGAVAGGGSVTIPVFYNGTTWIVG